MQIASQIGELLLERKAHLATAESCTGGLIGHLLTNVPGSSRWYVGGVVAYSNEVKHGLLGVRQEVLERVGAVSEEVAEQLALGARQAFDTEYAISVTGIAGPDGGTDEKPVGLVYIGIATPDQVVVQRNEWQGSREGIKQSSADRALALLYDVIQGKAHDQKEEGIMQPSAAVEARFLPDGTIQPRTFVWDGRSMTVTDWGRSWEKESKRHFLVMTADQRVWELAFRPAALHWSIQPKSEPRLLV